MEGGDGEAEPRRQVIITALLQFNGGLRRGTKHMLLPLVSQSSTLIPID